MFDQYGLGDALEDPQSGKNKEEWKNKCYSAVDAREAAITRANLAGMNQNLQLYAEKLKSWNSTPPRVRSLRWRSLQAAIS